MRPERLRGIKSCKNFYIKEIELYPEGSTKSLKNFHLEGQDLIYTLGEKSLGYIMKNE